MPSHRLQTNPVDRPVTPLANLPWANLAAPLAAAEDRLARLDDRLCASPIRAGWIARIDIADACANLALDGELVRREDLVLHDAGMDLRAPTRELVRAHRALLIRRRIWRAPPGWALTETGLAALLQDTPAPDSDDPHAPTDDEEGRAHRFPAATPTPPDDWRAAIAALDDAVARSGRVLAALDEPSTPPIEATSPRARSAADPLRVWRAEIAATANLPPTLAAALALETWTTLDPAPRQPWMGRLLVSALLRARGKTRAHLIGLDGGLRLIARERRRAASFGTRLVATLEAITGAADAGLKDHDRWLTARDLLVRKLAGRRATSRLPALIDLVMERPLLTAGMIAKSLAITPHAAQNLARDLALKELTGRTRYRAWGVP